MSQEYIQIACDKAIVNWEVRYVILQSSSYIELAEFWAVTNKCRTKDDAKWCIFPYMDGAKA